MKGTQHEVEIRDILSRSLSPEQKADKIREFMDWNREELIDIIRKIGTSTQPQQSEIIAFFWDRTSRKSGKLW